MWPKKKIFELTTSAVVIGILLLCGCATSQPEANPLTRKFAELPMVGLNQRPILPTANHDLFNRDSLGFVARSADNEAYGMPGWTRDLGQRFHKGVDILPVRWKTTGERMYVNYTDHSTGRAFSRWEKVKIPADAVYAILDGRVVISNPNEKRSGYGKYVMLEHHWGDGTPFVSLYAHLSRVEVQKGAFVRQGMRIGLIGQTSNNPGGRYYLKFIPHLHFEVGCVIDPGFGFREDLEGLVPLSGPYDPRNIQPYQPLEFLSRFCATPAQAVPAVLSGREVPAK